MQLRRFQWSGGRSGAAELAREIRGWAKSGAEPVDVGAIGDAVSRRGDSELIELTRTYDATELVRAEAGPGTAGEGEPGGRGEAPPSGLQRPDGTPWRLRVESEDPAAALERLEPALREALELAAENVEAVASAQLGGDGTQVHLPQGQQVDLREVPVRSAGIYVPGGRIAYPSSLIMAAIPARVAGVERLVVCSPPRPDGALPDAVLATAALCGVDELYAVGGAQAIFAMARGTESIEPVDVIAGPGSARVQEAKRAVFGEVGIDSIAGPSELMVIASGEPDVRVQGLDLCAQAEHGDEGLLVVCGLGDGVEERIGEAAAELGGERPGVGEAPLALVDAPDRAAAAALADALSPEHLQIDIDRDAALSDLPGPETTELAASLRTPGCVFCGPLSATAFGDYVAGSNHVLPTGGAGRFCGPLGPAVFRRRISTVTVPAAAARALAPHVDRIAREEGLPVHGESALARVRRAGGEGGEGSPGADG